MDWIVTLPKTIKWENYEKEISAVATGELVMNYKLPYLPKDLKPGDRCYVTHNGAVRGWMEVVGVKRIDQGFYCQTTGTFWHPGIYMERSGAFNKISPILYKGFRGIRRFKL